MNRAAVLGVAEQDGKHFAFSELHEPCLGGPNHIGCTVKRRDECRPRDTQDEAVADMVAVHREVGWKPEIDA